MDNLQLEKVAMIARVCHEANRAYCRTIGDDSIKGWDEAPEWQRASAIDGARFHITHPNAGPAASHNNWLALKGKEGWVYGETKDPDATPPTHPCMRLYQDLPIAQRRKDVLFIGIVRALMTPFSS